MTLRKIYTENKILKSDTINIEKEKNTKLLNYIYKLILFLNDKKFTQNFILLLIHIFHLWLLWDLLV